MITAVGECVCEALLVLPPVLFSTEVMSLLTSALFQISCDHCDILSVLWLLADQDEPQEN